MVPGIGRSNVAAKGRPRGSLKRCNLESSDPVTGSGIYYKVEKSYNTVYFVTHNVLFYAVIKL